MADGDLLILLASGVAVDVARANALIDGEEVAWAKFPRALRELVRGMLSGADQDGDPASVFTVAQPPGEFGYDPGVAGRATIPTGARVVGIAARAPSGVPASVEINGGGAILISAGDALSLSPVGKLVDPDIEFTGTASYLVEYVT